MGDRLHMQNLLEQHSASIAKYASPASLLLKHNFPEIQQCSSPFASSRSSSPSIDHQRPAQRCQPVTRSSLNIKHHIRQPFLVTSKDSAQISVRKILHIAPNSSRPPKLSHAQQTTTQSSASFRQLSATPAFKDAANLPKHVIP